tara:strand:- start:9562 stop:9879 length:318 start_codon:yes stop_codon:yes gene_type:complete
VPSLQHSRDASQPHAPQIITSTAPMRPIPPGFYIFAKITLANPSHIAYQPRRVTAPADACAPLAQLDRAPDYGSGGWEFEPLGARHSFQGLSEKLLGPFSFAGSI